MAFVLWAKVQETINLRLQHVDIPIIRIKVEFKGLDNVGQNGRELINEKEKNMV